MSPGFGKENRKERSIGEWGEMGACLLRATWWSISLKTKYELRYIPLVPEPMTPPLQDQWLWSGPSPHRHLGAYMEARARLRVRGREGQT